MISYYISTIEDENDREFITAVFQQYQRLMYQTIYRSVKNAWDTEDLMQSVLEQLIKKVNVLRQLNRDQMVSYIVVSCRNSAAGHWRYKKKHPCVLLDEGYELIDNENDQEAIEFQIISENERQCFAELWGTLDERSRYILEKHYILGQSDAELARELGVQPQSVRMALSRARKSALKRIKEASKREHLGGEREQTG